MFKQSSSTCTACCLLVIVMATSSCATNKPAPVSANLVLADPASTTPATSSPAAEASIPFANNGGIRDWQVVDDASLLIEDNHGQWYLAKLQAPARLLSFSESLGFITLPSGTLERMGQVVARGFRYPIISLTRTQAPARKKNKTATATEKTPVSATVKAAPAK